MQFARSPRSAAAAVLAAALAAARPAGPAAADTIPPDLLSPTTYCCASLSDPGPDPTPIYKTSEVPCGQLTHPFGLAWVPTFQSECRMVCCWLPSGSGIWTEVANCHDAFGGYWTYLQWCY